MKEGLKMINNKMKLGPTEKELLTEKFLKGLRSENFVDVDILIDEISRSSKMYDQQDIKDFLNNIADVIYND
jgi:hypothetical protein